MIGDKFIKFSTAELAPLLRGSDSPRTKILQIYLQPTSDICKKEKQD